jgi:hypothetical protein
MIESVIGRLRRSLGAICVVGATALGLFAATMALASAPAFAAAPEEPHTEAPSPIAGTTATFKGELNPGTNEEAVKYHFAYSPGLGAACTESGATAPVEPALYLETSGKHKKVTTAVTGLEGSTEYTVCLVAAVPTEEAEFTVGTSKTFTTLASKPVVTEESTTETTPFATTLQASVNPENQSTTCEFEYGKVVTEHKEPCEQNPIEGGVQPVTLKVTALTPASTYHYRVVVKNVTGELKDTEASFTTLTLEKPSIISESVSGIVAGTTPFEARLEAIVNADYQATTCHFEYGTASVSEHEAPCEQTGFEGEEAVGASLSSLEAATIYHYRIVATNGTGTETGPEQEFETVRPPSELETGEAHGIATTSANIEGNLLDAGGEASYYIEYGTAPCSNSTCGEKTKEEFAGGRAQEPVASFPLSGLKPDTTYHYRLVATNAAAGAPVDGTAKEFKTLLAEPTQFETGEAEAITTTSADLGGEINPGGEARYYVEYGTEPCVEAAEEIEETEEEIPVSCGTRSLIRIARGTTDGPVTPIAVGGLKPNTTYHYWLVVENAAIGEPVHGMAHVFTTSMTPAEIEEEAAAAKKPGEEAAAGAAAKLKLEQEAAKQEAATAATAAATKKLYEEISAVTAADERQAAEAKRVEALIAATSVKITKTKVTAGGVIVTVKITQPGSVAIAGKGLKGKVAKLATGTHTITVKLTSAGKKDRKHHEETTVTATLSTSLTSVSGSTTIKL